MTDLPRLGRAKIVSKDGKRITCSLGEGPPLVPSGYGGWRETVRPRRKPIVDWEAGVPFRMELPLLFNEWPDGSVEDDIRTLEAMARRADGEKQPHWVKVYLPGNRPRSFKVKWVIEDLTWGADLRRGNGDRCRQWVVVKLLERTVDELLPPAKKRKKGKGGGGGGGANTGQGRANGTRQTSSGVST